MTIEPTNPLEKVFLSQTSMSTEIERLVTKEGYTYFDAIIEFAAEIDRSPEELLPFMSKAILDKVRKSAEDEGYIQPQSLSLEDFEDGT